MRPARERGVVRRPPPPAADAGGPAIAGIATALGAGVGAIVVSRIGYLYADATLPGRELEAAALIVFGGFGGAIVGGAAACWGALRIGHRRMAGETAWRALAFLFMLSPIVLFGTPALNLTPLAGLGMGVVAAGLAGVAARLLTPARGADAGHGKMP